MDFQTVFNNIHLVINGMVKSITFLFISLFAGVVLSTILSITYKHSNNFVRKIIDNYILIFMGTPFIVQLFFFYYVIPSLDIVKNSSLWILFYDADRVALLTLILNTTAYTTDIYNNTLNNIGQGLYNAGVTCGLSFSQIHRKIILPLMYRNSFEQYTNECIYSMHATSLFSAITVTELSYMGGKLSSDFYIPFESYITIGVGYLFLTFLILLVLRGLKKVMLPTVQKINF